MRVVRINCGAEARKEVLRLCAFLSFVLVALVATSLSFQFEALAQGGPPPPAPMPDSFVENKAVAPASVAHGAAGVVSHGPTPFQFIFSSVQFFLVGFFVYYMLAIRPQQLREDERKKFIQALKRNDEVITSGGILGKVVTMKDDTVTLDVGGNSKIRVHIDYILSLPPTFVSSDKASGESGSEQRS